MFSVRLENFLRLSEAVFQFGQIADDADVKFSPLQFSLTTSNRSLGFVASLHIWDDFFTEYCVDESLSSRISLQSFHNAMWDGQNYSSMTILMEQPRSRMVLVFQNSAEENAPGWQRELTLIPAVEEDLGRLEPAKYFQIRSKNFRHIIRESSPFPNDPICVTLTHSQVKFSVASKEFVLIEQAGECQILGYEEGDTAQYRIILHPINFFLRLSYQAETVRFYKTMDESHCAISIPAFDFSAECLIFFPQP